MIGTATPAPLDGAALFVHAPTGCCPHETASALAAWRHGRDVIHVLVAVGDVVIDLVRNQLGGKPIVHELVVALAKVNAHTVRGVIDLVAEELERRRVQRDQLLRGGVP